MYEKLFIDIFKYQKGLELFFSEYQIKSNSKILDLGSGTGSVIKSIYNILSKEKFSKLRFTATDISPVMLNHMKRWLINYQQSNVCLIEGDVLDTLNKIHHSFDLITSSGMIEYIDKDTLPRMLAIYKKHLKSHGKILFFISKQNITNLVLIKFFWGANLFSKKEITGLLTGAKFTNIEFLVFPKKYNYLNRWGYIVEAS